MTRQPNGARRLATIGLSLLLWAGPLLWGATGGPRPAEAQSSSVLYLPLVTKNYSTGSRLRTVNAPFFPVSNVMSGSTFGETAIFWFGRVTSAENYADVRVGYNNTALYVYTAIFDRRLWYDTTPSSADLLNWDALSLYLDLDYASDGQPTTRSYRFDGQFNDPNDPRSGYQYAYRGNGTGWAAAAIPFTTTVGARGDPPLNGDVDKRGWAETFIIPFSSLGLAGPPATGASWGMAMRLYDRDDLARTAIPVQFWPELMDGAAPGTWARLRFGWPVYTPPPLPVAGTAVIRQGLNGTVVPDSNVGGYSNCGGSLDYWTEWGNQVYHLIPNSGEEYGDFVVGNGSDIADWPCFSKYYLTFPLTALPANKSILSATLTLYQFGAFGDNTTPASPVQVLSVAEDWQETTLAWNNAPAASENASLAYVPFISFPGWPGVPRMWDMRYAVAQAYAAAKPLRLVIYSADGNYNSGRIFVGSDVGDWNGSARPTIQVTWGNP